jgi:hypothetical protein
VPWRVQIAGSATLLFRQSNFEDRACAGARDTAPACRPGPNLRSGQCTASRAKGSGVVGVQLGVASVDGTTQMKHAGFVHARVRLFYAASRQPDDFFV